MPGTNQRTWQRYHVGHVLITVQLDSAALGPSFERHQELIQVAGRLIEVADSHRLPLTWAISDPAQSPATSRILRSAIDHELAILGDTSWIGASAGRTRFARELMRRLAEARGAGLNVSSLAPHAASIERHIDLVVKQQITAVAGCPMVGGERNSSAPRALHYGVWEMPISQRLPLESKWIFAGKRATWAQIRRTSREAGIFHLAIDAAEVAQSGRRAEKTFAWLARRIAVLRDRGLVRVETLRSMAARLADVPAVKPQRSILRAAA